MKKLFKGLVPVALASLMAVSAQAATTSSSFQVTATVSAACTVSATAMAFGAIIPSSTTASTATNVITSTCTNTTPYVLSFSKGNGSFATRTMAGAISGNTDALAYNIYKEVAHTNIVGDGTSSTVTLSATGTGVAQTATLYGIVTTLQYVKPDTYSDTIAVTLTY